MRATLENMRLMDLLIELYQLTKEKEYINNEIGCYLRNSSPERPGNWDYIGIQTTRLGEIRKRTLCVLNLLNEFDIECTQQ